jgi:hypothetical protein
MIQGDQIFVRTVSAGRIPREDSGLRGWQYHPRSDARSKAACWGIAFDLMNSCGLLREHALAGKVGFGINHEMRDFRMNRKKNLDLVICTPQGNVNDSAGTLSDLAERYRIVLSESESKELSGLPPLMQTGVGRVLLALEAKACMTEHSKACPRLYDELSSSFHTILGDTQSAIAAAFVSINASSDFASPIRNKGVGKGDPVEVSLHKQPRDAVKVLEKIRELPRRSGEDELGYDAVGAVFVECRNDGSAVTLVDALEDGTQIDPILSYQSLISRVSGIYSSRFRGL